MDFFAWMIRFGLSKTCLVLFPEAKRMIFEHNAINDHVNDRIIFFKTPDVLINEGNTSNSENPAASIICSAENAFHTISWVKSPQ